MYLPYVRIPINGTANWPSFYYMKTSKSPPFAPLALERNTETRANIHANKSALTASFTGPPSLSSFSSVTPPRKGLGGWEMVSAWGHHRRQAHLNEPIL